MECWLGGMAGAQSRSRYSLSGGAGAAPQAKPPTLAHAHDVMLKPKHLLRSHALCRAAGTDC